MYYVDVMDICCIMIIMSIIYDVMSMYVLYSTTVYLQYTTSTQNQRLRTFLSSCNKRYNWRYEISDFTFVVG